MMPGSESNYDRVTTCFLQMYVGGQLIHADCVFNGYGTTKRDFLKQVLKLIHVLIRIYVGRINISSTLPLNSFSLLTSYNTLLLISSPNYFRFSSVSMMLQKVATSHLTISSRPTLEESTFIPPPGHTHSLGFWNF